MKNFKIGKKLLVTFSTIIALFIVTVVVSIFSLETIGGSFTEFYQKPFPVTSAAANLRTDIQAFGKFVGYSIMTEDKQESASYVQDAQDRVTNMKDGVEFMRANFDDTALVDKFDQTMQSTTEKREQVLQLALDNRNDEAAELYFSDVMPALMAANDILLEIDDSATTIAGNNYQASMTQKMRVLFILLALSAVALAATVILALYITKGLTRPIKELEAAANEMAKGNLKINVGYISRDELGSLAESMRTMSNNISNYMEEITSSMQQLADGDLDVKKRDMFLGDFLPVQMAIRSLVGSLNDTLGRINQSADQVASGSDQVSSGSQALSQGATEQASSVQQLAATINEISAQVKQNADSAQRARETVDQVGAKLTASNQQMQEMTKAMGEISGASGEIGKIIKTIEDIAFQTNILALNAAVEAARAGAAGKGFAVVADEVRNLASKSSEASKSTSELIESSLRAVERGTRIADETAASLLTVVEGTKEITAQVSQIANASTEQAGSVMQVTQGIDQISSVVQTNSATAEESAAASEELSGQAQILRELVGKFKLKDTAAMNIAVSEFPADSPQGALPMDSAKY